MNPTFSRITADAINAYRTILRHNPTEHDRCFAHRKLIEIERACRDHHCPDLAKQAREVIEEDKAITFCDTKLQEFRDIVNPQ